MNNGENNSDSSWTLVKPKPSRTKRNQRYKAYVLFCIFVTNVPYFIICETPFDNQKYGFPGGSFKTKSSKFEKLSEDEQRHVVVSEAETEVHEELPGILSIVEFDMNPLRLDWIGPHITKVDFTDYISVYLFANITEEVKCKLKIGRDGIQESDVSKIHEFILKPLNIGLEQNKNAEVIRAHMVSLNDVHKMLKQGIIWKPHADVLSGVAKLYQYGPPGMKGQLYKDIIRHHIEETQSGIMCEIMTEYHQPCA